MSSTNDLKRFEADLAKSEELQKKLEGTVKRIAAEGTAANDGELMAAAAAELGYEISVAELERAAAEAEDMDDGALDSVVGGLGSAKDEYGNDAWCIAAWHCFAATMHTESNSKLDTCWSNYKCWLISEGTPK